MPSNDRGHKKTAIEPSIIAVDIIKEVRFLLFGFRIMDICDLACRNALCDQLVTNIVGNSI